MTLITLSIIVILLVGFLSTMLTERRAATAFEDTQRVELIAAGAVSHAIDLLRTNIPEPARLSEGPKTAPGENWVTNPGRLTVIREGQSPVYIPLHTGEVTDAPKPGPRDAESVDLNQPLPGETTPAITGLAAGTGAERPPMRVRWVNLQRDPSREAAADNPLTGRYAFWMDDESARLNINTALGKPAPGKDTSFDAQLAAGFLTPLFTRGSRQITYAQAAPPEWALGRPQSVNLDVLFDSPEQLQHDRLLDHLFLQGYARHPETILDFTTLRGTAAREWFDRARYELTAYSRAPEFNAFGRSRFFTTYVPGSLEAGPSYQQPFLFDPTGAYSGLNPNGGNGLSPSEVLHLNSLLGTFGFTSAVTDEDGASVNGGNVVNRAQVEMIDAYLHRRWPGYNRSFAEKYGEAETRQLALNAALMARLATTQIGNANLAAFTKQFSFRSTSVNYSPASNELQGRTPERMYWRFPGLGKNGLFLPQMPGPHITEVRLFVRATNAAPAPKNNPALLAGKTQPRYIQYWFETEYYMHPFGPVVDVSEFPMRTDYFEAEPAGYQRQQFGPADATDNRFDKDWTEPTNLGKLLVQPKRGGTEKLGPLGAKFGGEDVPNRRVYTSQVFTLGQRPNKLPIIDGTDFSNWDPFVFDAASGTVTLNLRFRVGMGVFDAPARPRQMIPLGETREDTLKATFAVNLQELNRDQAVSWQINDPRLSHDLAQWEANRQGPGAPGEVGTPKLPNVTEPAENSPEKSKFRYLLRAPAGSKLAGFELDRPDEYDPRSRVSSPGYWSLLHTGMQSGKAWRTLDFGPEAATPGALTGNDTSPPDWLFLDLLGATYPMANDQWRIEGRQPDEFSTASFMNSTAGQINLNSRIYPRTAYFRPPERLRPLQAVFQYLPGLNNPKSVAAAIESYQTDEQVFDYVGEVSKILAGATSGTTPWQRESVLRNMAGVLTTKSNTFGVWGVAQVVKKVPKNTGYDRFERGDQIIAEKRFYALVERHVWSGRDGLPGNAHTSTQGRWDRLAAQSSVISTASGVPDTLFGLPGSPPLFRSGQRLNLDTNGAYAEFDGPERVSMNPFTEVALGKVRWRESSLEDAYNPPQALIKYRVVSFKYLDQ